MQDSEEMALFAEQERRRAEKTRKHKQRMQEAQREAEVAPVAQNQPPALAPMPISPAQQAEERERESRLRDLAEQRANLLRQQEAEASKLKQHEEEARKRAERHAANEARRLEEMARLEEQEKAEAMARQQQIQQQHAEDKARREEEERQIELAAKEQRARQRRAEQVYEEEQRRRQEEEEARERERQRAIATAEAKEREKAKARELERTAEMEAARLEAEEHARCVEAQQTAAAMQAQQTAAPQLQASPQGVRGDITSLPTSSASPERRDAAAVVAAIDTYNAARSPPRAAAPTADNATPTRPAGGTCGIAVKLDKKTSRVTKIYENGPAWRQGELKEGDMIKSVDGMPVEKCYELGRMMLGPEGSIVVLVVDRDGQPLTINVPRGKIAQAQPRQQPQGGAQQQAQGSPPQPAPSGHVVLSQLV